MGFVCKVWDLTPVNDVIVFPFHQDLLLTSPQSVLNRWKSLHFVTNKEKGKYFLINVINSWVNAFLSGLYYFGISLVLMQRYYFV